jgi:FeS assembly SUF system protein
MERSTDGAAAPANEQPTKGEIDPGRIRAGVVLALKDCYDPEIPVDVYELGLIYGIEVDAEGRVEIKMTLTSPACPVAGSLPGEVEQRVRAVAGVSEAEIELVWEPPWDREMMSEAAKLKLGFL